MSLHVFCCRVLRNPNVADTMNLDLNGMNAAVAGATRGIGLAIAKQLVAENCNVSICARNADGVDATVKALQSSGVKVMGSALDATDRTAQTNWLEDSAKALGGLDIFIANVSALNTNADEEAWRQSLEVDMMATVYGAEAAIPLLKQSKAGAMVFIASVAALQTKGTRPYGSAKAAVIHYSKSLARELAADGIRVNAVSPGNIYFEDGVWGRVEKNNPEFFAEMLAANPLGRMGNPEEVANATVFLASPAASFISGTNLLVDGALTTGVQY